MSYRVAADIGGTFTDIALLTSDGSYATCKVPSTPPDFERAIIRGIRQLLDGLGLPDGELGEVLHACTVGTNAVLEQKGARTAFVTTAGFRDLLELRRIRVPRLYDPLYVKPAPLVPRNLCFEVRERIDFQGAVVEPLDEGGLPALADRLGSERVEAVAICLINSFVNPRHEQIVGRFLDERLPGCFVTLSSDVLPEIREYERASTTVINAYVGPPVSRYLSALLGDLRRNGLSAPLRVMQSSGGILDSSAVLSKPAQMIECGPAAGVIGAAHVSRLSGFDKVITFDMGGTTAKAALVEKGEFQIADEYEVGGGISLGSRLVKGGGYPLRLPAIDVSEVGAGGGSIVWLDRAGAIKVGPQSVGAVPGPACYGAGNEEPTVTDANVVLGFLNPRALAGRSVPISADLSREAVQSRIAEPLGQTVLDAAFGIHSVANSNMMRAVKSVTTYNGRDPREFSILAFGGNGGIHAVELARSLRVCQVVVPPAAGVFSALGLLFADTELTLTRGVVRRTDQLDPGEIEAGFRALEARCAAQMGYDRQALRFRRFLDMRYVGQAFEIIVAASDPPFESASLRAAEADFELAHERRHGHGAMGTKGFEIVNLRVTGTAPAETAPARFRGKPTKLPVEGNGETRPVYFGPAFGLLDTRIVSRAHLGSEPVDGPLVVEEYEGTIVLPPDSRARLDRLGNVIIDVEDAR